MHATTTMKPTQKMELSGALDQFDSFEVTPCIGTEFRNVNLPDWMKCKNSDAILRDLAITICERGVVFFRGQTGIDGELQKELTQKLGLLSGKPKNHKLFVHPLHESRNDDPEMGKLDATVQQALHAPAAVGIKQTHADEWHSDLSFEICPPDFSMLRMTAVPPTGGDTLFASGYELYDRLSPPYQKFFESLTATHDSPGLRKAAHTMDVIYKGERGAPANNGLEFKRSQLVVRTHPVTGWKALYSGGLHCKSIDGVTEAESDEIRAKILNFIANNHDLQVRFRWNGPGDIAIWDNRCVFHCATHDHQNRKAPRLGFRTVSIAEEPFLDPESKSRKQWQDEQLKIRLPVSAGA